MKKKIFLISTTRAEYGLTKNILLEKKKFKKINLKLIISGTHLSNFFGNTIKEIINDNIKIYKCINLNKKKINFQNVEKIFSKTLIKFSNFLKLQKPDAVILFGDRYETFAVALACVLNKITIFHIQGGEVTEGSIDNIFRNSISKMSKYHFVTNKISKKNIIKMGENPKNVFIIGSLFLDNLKRENFLPKKQIEKKFKFNFLNKNVLVTLHPETKGKILPDKQIKILLDVLKNFNDTLFIFTYPNQDKGHEIIVREIKKFVKKNKNAILIKSLGQSFFHSCLKHVDCIIGNSSSGIIEMPYFNKFSINIGNRQKGRPMARSVFSVPYNKNLIFHALNKINKGIKRLPNKEFLYGSGQAAGKMLRIINYKLIKNL